MSHRPDFPFGCPEMWGPVLGGPIPDMLTHVCNELGGHRGPHVCKCGEKANSE